MPTKRQNAVIIESQHIARIDPVNGSLRISEGQPSEWPPQVQQANDTFAILFVGGRHKTSEIADTFNGRDYGHGEAVNTDGNRSGAPRALNFFFGLTLTWKEGGTTDVFLAQGSNPLHNDWWLGSPKISGGAITAPDNKSYPIRIPTTDSVFPGLAQDGVAAITKELPLLGGFLSDLAGKSVQEIVNTVNTFSI